VGSKEFPDLHVIWMRTWFRVSTSWSW